MALFYDRLAPWKEPGSVFSQVMTYAVPLMALTLLITSVANAFVMLAVWKDPNRNLRRSPSNIIIASQALADFFVGAVTDPICIWWMLTLSDEAMHAIEAISSLFLASSVQHMMFLAYDRYTAVAKPTQHRLCVTSQHPRRVALGIWLFSVVYMCYRTAIRELSDSMAIVNIISGIHTILPACIGVLFYLKLLIVLRRYRKHLGHLDAKGQAVINAYARERKMTKAMVLILGLFLLGITPWFVSYQFIDACTTCDDNKTSHMFLLVACFYLFLAKSALNPFLYAWRLTQYRAAYKTLMCRRLMRRRVEGGSTHGGTKPELQGPLTR